MGQKVLCSQREALLCFHLHLITVFDCPLSSDSSPTFSESFLKLQLTVSWSDFVLYDVVVCTVQILKSVTWHLTMRCG